MKKLIVCVALIGMLLCGCSETHTNGRFVIVENLGLTRYIFGRHRNKCAVSEIR